jgi:hypothetical protein
VRSAASFGRDLTCAVVRVKQGVLQGLWKADALVTLQDHTDGLEYLVAMRGKSFKKCQTIALASLYSASGVRPLLLRQTLCPSCCSR